MREQFAALCESSFESSRRMHRCVCFDVAAPSSELLTFGIRSENIPFVFQLFAIISNEVDLRIIGLNTNSKLLCNLKSKVVNLASASDVISSVQSAAQAALQTGWSILLPTPNERAQTLSSLLPNAGIP